MKLIKIILLTLFISQSATGIANELVNNFESKPLHCSDGVNKTSLLNGWYLWEPYQFNKAISGEFVLTGMDVELVKSIAKRVGVEMKYQQIDWGVHQEELREGTRDIAAGATFTQSRSEFVYFSIPYRYEENSLFILQDNNKNLNFKSISEFLAQVRLQNFVIGVTKGFIYADPQINLFISDQANQDIIRQYSNDVESLENLLKGEIDGFMSDRVVGAAAILNNKAASFVKEVQLNIKTPIHLMFSKKSVPLELVDKFNQEIKLFENSSEYKKIVKTYVYPVLLLQTLDSQWFYIIGIIGTFAFAISGVAIAAKENITLFGTFLFALLPSVGGGIMRDVIINREEVGIILNPTYMYYVIIIVLVGFFLVRLLEYYNTKANEDSFIIKFWDNILVIGDALGQAAFVVTGVSIIVMAKIEPIELWGPFFAFLTGNGGGIIRDLMRKDHVIACIEGPFRAEITIIWGLIFSIYLDSISYNPDPNSIKNTVYIVVVGAFVTRLMTHYLNIPNLKFRKDIVKEEVIDIK